MKLKVLHVIDSEGIYGAETMLLGLMVEQQRMGTIPMLCSIGSRRAPEKAIEAEAATKGIAVARIRMSNGPNLFGVLKILRVAAEGRVDLIHSHGYKGNILLGFLPKAIRKVPLVATLHGWTSSGGLSRMVLYEWLDALSLTGMDAAVLVSKGMLANPRIARRHYRNLTVVDNGISMEYDAVLSEGDPIASFCDPEITIGCIGRLSLEKGHRFLVSALRFARDRGAPLKLVIVGEGPERANLEAQIADLGLTAHVLLPGYVKDASRCIPLFSLFVLPSLTEGLPITLLEAMRSRVPCIATTVGGIPHVLDHGRSGLLVPPSDAEGLARAILELLGRPDLRTAISEEAYRKIGSEYSAAAMAMKYDRLYERVVRSNTKS